MINRTAITQWNKIVPWNDNAQVEQDLIISRALVAIFSDKFLASQLAFRGGTALHKLYLSPQPRYSEDIDLVQITPGPIKPIMFKLGEVLSFLPDRVTKQKRYNNTMLFRMESEIPPTIPLRLKIEINCFEHFNELGLVKVPFEVENSWFSGKCEITTYRLNELLGTKLRALYQIKKAATFLICMLHCRKRLWILMKFYVATTVICRLLCNNHLLTNSSLTIWKKKC